MKVFDSISPRGAGESLGLTHDPVPSGDSLYHGAFTVLLRVRVMLSSAVEA